MCGLKRVGKNVPSYRNLQANFAPHMTLAALPEIQIFLRGILTLYRLFSAGYRIVQFISGNAEPNLIDIESNI